MQYRTFGRTDLNVSTLGFGLMRLPTNSEGEILEAPSREMVQYAIDEGINYLDTAHGYVHGNSEPFTARLLNSGYRDQVYLATKLPTWDVETAADFERFLQEQMERLQTDYLDIYMLHNLNSERWENLEKLGVTDFLDKAVADGRIGATGFSFHDDLDTFKRIVDGYSWDMCLIQLNFMDQHYQAGVPGLKYAAAKGLAVAVMEPLRGGKLAGRVPDEVQALWEQADTARSAAEWAFRWVCNFPEVSVVLSGMNTMEQIKENIAIVKDAYPNSLTEEELALIDQVRDVYLSRMVVNCTSCDYCMPCPQGVNIPVILNQLNEASMYENEDEVADQYTNLYQNEKGANLCIACGQCEAACPQSIAIIDALEEAHRRFLKND